MKESGLERTLTPPQPAPRKRNSPQVVEFCPLVLSLEAAHYHQNGSLESADRPDDATLTN